MNPLPRLHVEMFHYYCPELPVKRVRRDLPHWEQEGVCAFATFRLGDALPESVIEGWIAERDAWLVGHDIYPSANEDWKDALKELGDGLVKAFHRRFTARLHDLLDAGHGECLLRRADLRRVVEESLMHWHGERYLLAGWVIMPNHVHVLVQPMEGWELLKL